MFKGHSFGSAEALQPSLPSSGQEAYAQGSALFPVLRDLR